MTQPPIDFTALDFETANRHRASICSVGAVRVRDGRIVGSGYRMIQPPEGYRHFERRNVMVHGLTPDSIIGAEPADQVLDRLLDYIGDGVVVSHGPFDRQAMARASEVLGRPVPGNPWTDGIRAAQATMTMPSYRLSAMTAHFGIALTDHHNALADAIAAAEVMIAMAAMPGFPSWALTTGDPAPAPRTGGYFRYGARRTA